MTWLCNWGNALFLEESLQQPALHQGGKVQCQNLHQNVAVAALDRERWFPAPEWQFQVSQTVTPCRTRPEAEKETLNDQFH